MSARLGMRSIAGLALGCAIAGLAAAALAAEDSSPYPSRPITLLTPVPAGGAVDRITRAWMACAQAQGGQPLVLQYRPGGNGVVAVTALRQAPADGYTLMVTGMSQTTIVPFIFTKQPFDPKTDLAGAAIFATTPYLLVASSKSNIRSMAELVTAARAAPGGLDIGIPNIATPAHLLSAALAAHLEAPATLVPTSGEAGGLTALMSGTLPAMIFLPGTVAPYIASGALTPLLAFSDKRLAEFPSVPTVSEATGQPDLVRPGWLGLAARAGTPPTVIRAVEAWTRSCVENPAFRKTLADALVVPQFAPQAEMGRWIDRDIAFWKPWIERLRLVQAN